MNGETIQNVLQLVVVEIRCGCALAPIQYHRMEENLVWAHILSPENAIHSPAQVLLKCYTDILPHRLFFK